MYLLEEGLGGVAALPMEGGSSYSWIGSVGSYALGLLVVDVSVLVVVVAVLLDISVVIPESLTVDDLFGVAPVQYIFFA